LIASPFPNGGIIIIDFEPIALKDKIEITSNGLKKAVLNVLMKARTFDELFIDPTVPDYNQALNVDQFIGRNKGATPTRRDAEFSFPSLLVIQTYQELKTTMICGFT
jgi:hypothetical protein